MMHVLEAYTLGDAATKKPIDGKRATFAAKKIKQHHHPLYVRGACLGEKQSTAQH
jgi:hypothetical protein